MPAVHFLDVGPFFRRRRAAPFPVGRPVVALDVLKQLVLERERVEDNVYVASPVGVLD